MGEQASKLRRIVTRVIVLLLLGAIVNVAVAWGCALLIQVDLTSQVRLSRQIGPNIPFDMGVTGFGSFRTVSERYWDEVCYGGYADVQIPPWGLEALQNGFTPPRPKGVVLDARGWPRLCLYSLANVLERDVVCGIDIRGTTDPNAAYKESFALPIGIIWPGFAINMIFYAVTLWLLWAAPGAIRRVRRKQRGLCIHCGYDLRGAAPDSANCPECGKPLSRLESRQVNS